MFKKIITLTLGGLITFNTFVFSAWAERGSGRDVENPSEKSLVVSKERGSGRDAENPKDK